MNGWNSHHGGHQLEQLDQHGEHYTNSHDDDKSKYLKNNQIVAVSDAVIIAPQQSRNMQLAGPESPGKNIALELLLCVQHVVHVSLAPGQLTIKQLQRFDIDNLICTAHLSSVATNAKRDIVHINIILICFLFNIFVR